MTDCGCKTEHPVIETIGEPEGDEVGFYVTARDEHNRGRYAKLLGPFTTHDEALAKVDLGRRLAHQYSPREAAWASYGTAKVTGVDLEPGRLNEMEEV